jgi:hypothetical protein
MYCWNGWTCSPESWISPALPKNSVPLNSAWEMFLTLESVTPNREKSFSSIFHDIRTFLPFGSGVK